MTRHATLNELHVNTQDTTLEALLTGQARLVSYQDWPAVNVIDLRDPFQDAAPCWQAHYVPTDDGKLTARVCFRSECKGKSHFEHGVNI